MADEIRNSLLTSNGGRTAEILSALIVQQLYDDTALRRYITQVPQVGMGSSVTAVTKDAVPAAAAAASSEISGGASNTAYTTSKVQFTIARYLLKYQATDLLGMTAGPGMIDAKHIVNKLLETLDLTLTDLIAALFPSLAVSVGTTAVNLSVSNIYSAMYQLILSKVKVGPGQPVVCVLHQQQYVDFKESLRNEPGAMQFQVATADMLKMKSPGSVGMWNDIEFISCDSVGKVNGDADYSGAMFGAGCFGYQLGNCQALLNTIQVPRERVLIDTPEIFVELDRDTPNGMSSFYANFYPAVSEIEDLRGVEIITAV